MSLVLLVPHVRALLDIRGISKDLYHDEKSAHVQTICAPTALLLTSDGGAANKLRADAEDYGELVADHL